MQIELIGRKGVVLHRVDGHDHRVDTAGQDLVLDLRSSHRNACQHTATD